eukprot:gnl/Dysnectes_brevis/937_a1043_2941.p1 GENE.gnl/Dysnectes_brevis/937_a1043_2941~~gnl/Dysnectes_brevis/937_a1043_2941.p1  ORF type:complete len:236 (+),score=52.86 gnl/Dysnectes_brevis/937_a1043_2941:56-763(+)
MTKDSKINMASHKSNILLFIFMEVFDHIAKIIATGSISASDVKQEKKTVSIVTKNRFFCKKSSPPGTPSSSLPLLEMDLPITNWSDIETILLHGEELYPCAPALKHRVVTALGGPNSPQSAQLRVFHYLRSIATPVPSTHFRKGKALAAARAMPGWMSVPAEEVVGIYYDMPNMAKKAKKKVKASITKPSAGKIKWLLRVIMLYYFLIVIVAVVIPGHRLTSLSDGWMMKLGWRR